MRDVLGLLSAEQRTAVLASGRRRRFRRGDVVVHEGDPSDAIHLIMTGHVGIRVTTPRGDQAIVGIRGPGQVVGEMALVGASPGLRTATVLALDPVELVTVHRARWSALLAEVPELSEWLVQLLAQRLHDTSGQLRDAMFEPAEVRVLRRLLAAAEDFDAVEVPLSQTDLAAMAGTTRSTVNRVLQAAQDDDLVLTARGRVTLLDMAELHRRAGVGSGPLA